MIEGTEKKLEKKVVKTFSLLPLRMLILNAVTNQFYHLDGGRYHEDHCHTSKSQRGKTHPLGFTMALWTSTAYEHKTDLMHYPYSGPESDIDCIIYSFNKATTTFHVISVKKKQKKTNSNIHHIKTEANDRMGTFWL